MRSSPLKFLIATAVLLSAVAPTLALAGGNCGGQKYDDLNKVDPKDPCAEKQINHVASIAQSVSAVGHAVAGTICTIACVSPLNFAENANIAGGFSAEVGGSVTWCGRAGWGTMIVDIGGAVAVQAESIAKKKKIDEQQLMGSFLTVALGAVGIVAPTLATPGELAATDLVSDATKEGYHVTEAADGSAEGCPTCGNGGGEQESNFEMGSCIAAVTHGVQAIQQSAQMAMSMQRKDTADKKKARVLSGNLKPRLQGGGANETPPAGGPPPVGDPRGSGEHAANADESPAEEMGSAFAASAGPEMLSGANLFNKLTGKTVQDVIDKMLNENKNAYQAASELAGEALGSKGQEIASKIASIDSKLDDETKKTFAAANEKEFKNVSSGGFASTAKGAVAKKSNDQDDLLAGLGDMLKGIMPKKAEAKKIGPKATVSFGLDRAPASAVDANGFHSPQQSIFSAINARYKTLSKSLLSDGF